MYESPYSPRSSLPSRDGAGDHDTCENSNFPASMPYPDATSAEQVAYTGSSESGQPAPTVSLSGQLFVNGYSIKQHSIDLEGYGTAEPPSGSLISSHAMQTSTTPLHSSSLSVPSIPTFPSIPPHSILSDTTSIAPMNPMANSVSSATVSNAAPAAIGKIIAGASIATVDREKSLFEAATGNDDESCRSDARAEEPAEGVGYDYTESAIPQDVLEKLGQKEGENTIFEPRYPGAPKSGPLFSRLDQREQDQLDKAICIEFKVEGGRLIAVKALCPQGSAAQKCKRQKMYRSGKKELDPWSFGRHIKNYHQAGSDDVAKSPGMGQSQM